MMLTKEMVILYNLTETDYNADQMNSCLTEVGCDADQADRSKVWCWPTSFFSDNISILMYIMCVIHICSALWALQISIYYYYKDTIIWQKRIVMLTKDVVIW